MGVTWWLGVWSAWAQSFIVGGGPAAVGDWPDAVALYAEGTFACSGVLIAPDAVLTARHCGNTLDEAVLGEVDSALGPRVAVRTVSEHPDRLDVMVAHLAQPVEDLPRSLASTCILDGVVPGDPVSIVGYGVTRADGSGERGVLYEATSTVRSTTCEDTSLGCSAAAPPDHELIAGGDGVDSCVGDSGGPLYLEDGSEHVVIGVTSRGIQQADTLCGAGGIYVRVDAITGWLRDELGLSVSRVGCPDGLEAWGPPRLEVSAGGTAWTAFSSPVASVAWTLQTVPEGLEAELLPGGLLRVTAQGTARSGSLVVRGDDDRGNRRDLTVEVVVTEASSATCSHLGTVPWWLGLVSCWWRRRRCA